MQEAHLRRFFDSQLAANAEAIQRDAQRMARLRLLRPSARARAEQLRQRFATELARPVVEQLRPGWTYEPESALAEDELFASGLFQRIPLTRFETTARIRGTAHDLPFDLREVTATGEAERQYARIVLIGFLAQLKLATPAPGRVRFCHRQVDKAWRRPSMDGYHPLTPTLSPVPGEREMGTASPPRAPLSRAPSPPRPPLPQEGGEGWGEGVKGPVYHVDATPDALPSTSLLGLATTLDDFARHGWRVHVAFGGLSAWVAIEQSRTWFEPRALPPYTADDVLRLDATFAVVERIARELQGLAGAAGRS